MPQRVLLSTPNLGHVSWKQPTKLPFFQFYLEITCSLNENIGECHNGHYF